MAIMYALFVQDLFAILTTARDLHREQLSIEHSMQDLDSAVGRLDNIFMSLYVCISVYFYDLQVIFKSFIGGRCYSHCRSGA